MLNFIDKKKKNKNIKYCPYAFDSLIVLPDRTMSICKYNKYIAAKNYDEIWLDIPGIIVTRKNIKKSFKESFNNLQCNNCCYCEEKEETPEIHHNEVIKNLILSHWNYCNYNCINCTKECKTNSADTKQIYIMPAIKQLLKDNLIDKTTNIIFECGEAQLHPEFEKLFNFVSAYEFNSITIHTNGQLFSKEIADSIAQGMTKIIINIDAAGEYIYNKVKGINKYNDVLQNVEHYKMYEPPKQTSIILKYTMINGITDNQQGIVDFFIYGKEIGIKKFIIDIEDNWYNVQIIPEHFDSNLKKLIEYTIELSKINNYEIELSPKLKYLDKIRIATSFYRNR